MSILKTRSIRIIPVIILIAFFTGATLFADTIILRDKMLLVGKILKKSEKTIIFRNSYGLFRIKKINIEHIFITKNFIKDIEIHKALGKKVNEEQIKNDYMAGMGKASVKNKMPEDIRKAVETEGTTEEPGTGNQWTPGSIIFSGMYLYTTGKVKAALPYGYGGMVSYDQDLNFPFSEWHFLWPGFRLEGGYLKYKKDESEIKGTTWAGGPIWHFELGSGDYGNIVLSGTCGMSNIRIKHGSTMVKSDTLTAWGILGYEISFGIVLFQLQGRYLYAFDKDINIHSAAVLLGIGFKLW